MYAIFVALQTLFMLPFKCPSCALPGEAFTSLKPLYKQDYF
ncbi:hypothetical protein M23134_00805 [Microscilla marina ATCC 23134]|uniref:Uncharacterized protein n=1 Tax=Microscilla marina ATCC 23134 TaxID=313606 RepID=A1ZVX0_MICM2|nr:hypothetical protein M23134_00805 [Microscilla marina ATCC 23134]